MLGIKITRIQTRDTDNHILVGFSAGNPLPNGETGEMDFENKAAIRAAFRALKEKLTTEDLVVLSLVYAAKADPQLGAAALNNRINKVLTLDLEGAASPITVS